MSGKIIYTPLQKTDHLININGEFGSNLILSSELIFYTKIVSLPALCCSKRGFFFVRGLLPGVRLRHHTKDLPDLVPYFRSSLNSN